MKSVRDVLTVPEICWKELRLQRTGCDKTNPVPGYLQSLQKDLEWVLPHLDRPPVGILDIGCGLGGIDILLRRQIECHTTLFDRNAMDRKVRYGYTSAEQMSAYCTRAATEALQKANPSPPTSTWEFTSDDPWTGRTYDVVISLISWGFHYPVETYYVDVVEHLAPAGKVLIDVRKTVIDEASKIFDADFILKEQQETLKYMRCAYVRR